MSDVENALNVLSKDKNTGHFNYWAAKMLQGKMALYKGDYQLAYSANAEVIENSPYSMVSNDEYLEYWGMQGHEETVLEFVVSPDGDLDSDGGSNADNAPYDSTGSNQSYDGYREGFQEPRHL